MNTTEDNNSYENKPYIDPWTHKEVNQNISIEEENPINIITDNNTNDNIHIQHNSQNKNKTVIYFTIDIVLLIDTIAILLFNLKKHYMVCSIFGLILLIELINIIIAFRNSYYFPNSCTKICYGVFLFCGSMIGLWLCGTEKDNINIILCIGFVILSNIYICIRPSHN